MQIIVNDTSCLIDLRKAGLRHAALLLPFAFQIALPLLRTALLEFTRAEIEDLIARGLAVIDLPPDSVGRAITFRSAYPALSIARPPPSASRFTACCGSAISSRVAVIPPMSTPWRLMRLEGRPAGFRSQRRTCLAHRKAAQAAGAPRQ